MYLHTDTENGNRRGHHCGRRRNQINKKKLALQAEYFWLLSLFNHARRNLRLLPVCAMEQSQL